MKILLISNHNPNFINTNFYREEALRRSGHECVFFDDRNFIIPGRVRNTVNFLQNWDLKRINRTLVRTVQKIQPDLCMVVGGQRILSDSISKIKKLGIKIILWTSDIPKDFKNILQTAAFYDYIFCAGTEAVEIFKTKGLKKVFWIPFACDPYYHKPTLSQGVEERKLKKKIVFIGSFYPNRAKLLESIADLDITVWGPNWQMLKEDSPLQGKAFDIALNYEKWVKIYSAADIVLIIHYDDGKTPCDQASPKLYEAMACKSFILCDNQKDAKILFEDRKHVVFYENQSDLRTKVLYYLNHQEECKKIARQGYQEVLCAHTYEHRIKKILSIIENK